MCYQAKRLRLGDIAAGHGAVPRHLELYIGMPVPSNSILVDIVSGRDADRSLPGRQSRLARQGPSEALARLRAPARGAMAPFFLQVLSGRIAAIPRNSSLCHTSADKDGPSTTRPDAG